MLRTHPATKDAVEANRNVVYNLLNRLARREELVKKGSRYSLPSKTNEASPGEPKDASVNGRGATLPFDNYEEGRRRPLHS